MTPWIADFILLAAIWGASFLFTRLGVIEFGAAPAAFVRVLIASCFLLPIMLMRGLGPQLRLHWKKTMLIGVLNSGIPFLCFAYALLTITTGLSAILNATVPLFGALIAWFWLKDRPTGSRIVGLVVGFAGIAMLVWDKEMFKPGASGVAPAVAILACLFATVLYAIAANGAKRYLAGLPALVTATGSQLGATVVLALPAVWTWPQKMPGSQAWLALVAVGVVCTGVAYVLYFRLIENAGPARAVAVTFLVPVFAILYGVLFLHEDVTLWMVVCGVVIVCGTALSTGLVALGRKREALAKS